MENDVGRSVRWGVMSTANIGRAAVNPAIQASGNGSLVAVASREEARAKEFAATHGIPTAYGSYEALLDDGAIDAVYIPLPNSMHREWVIRAAEAGKHVLCEKPLALDATECEEMAAAAEDNRVVLMEAFMYRFHPRTVRVVDMVREGVLGELKAIRSSFTFRLRSLDNIRLDPDLGGGALMDVGCYCVNVSRGGGDRDGRLDRAGRRRLPFRHHALSWRCGRALRLRPDDGAVGVVRGGGYGWLPDGPFGLPAREGRCRLHGGEGAQPRYGPRCSRSRRVPAHGRALRGLHTGRRSAPLPGVRGCCEHEGNRGAVPLRARRRGSHVCVRGGERVAPL